MASSTTALFINIAHRERLWENFIAASLHFCTWKVSCQLLPVIPLLLLVPDFGWCTFQDVFIYLFIRMNSFAIETCQKLEKPCYTLPQPAVLMNKAINNSLIGGCFPDPAAISLRAQET